MSRTTAEIVADLREVDGAPTVGALRREAADRLTDQLERLRNIDAARPVCPTCGGSGEVNSPRVSSPSWSPIPCPDCTDGRMPIERMAAIVNVVLNEGTFGAVIEAYRDHPRSVTP